MPAQHAHGRAEGGFAAAVEDGVDALAAGQVQHRHHYFPGGKEELLLAVAAREAERVLEDQEPHLSGLRTWSAWRAWRDAVLRRYEQQGVNCPLGEDRIEIQDLMVRYGLGQDLHEDGDNDVLEQWDSVFAPEARVDYSVAGGAQLKDIPFRDLVEVMRAPDGSMSGLLKWQHFQGFSTVDIDGDRAVARTQHLHTHKGDTDGQGWNLIQTGFFVDRLERRTEGWRIVHRTLEIIWMDTFATV